MTEAAPNAARARYLRLAANAFAENGFHGVSLAKLAATAGVTKQALLHFFASKERLYGAVLADLAERLLAEVEATRMDPTEAHLEAYFTAQLTGALADPQDARLVMRALLDSDAGARNWPLKPYLDTLTARLRETAAWRGVDDAAALAGLYQIIASIQYFAASAPTLKGMYGDDASRAAKERYAAGVADAVSRLVRRQ